MLSFQDDIILRNFFYFILFEVVGWSWLKAKESYLLLAKGLLALAKGGTSDSGGQERPHSPSRLNLCLSYSSAQLSDFLDFHIVDQ